MNNPPRLPNSCYKDDIPKSQRQKDREEKKRRQKGKDGEHAFGKALTEQLGGEYRVQNQAVEGGGMGNSDLWIKSLPGWAVEIKNRTHLAITLWWNKLTKENAGPWLLGFFMGEEQMVLMRVKDLRRFIQDGAESLGWELIPRGEHNAPKTK